MQAPFEATRQDMRCLRAFAASKEMAVSAMLRGAFDQVFGNEFASFCANYDTKSRHIETKKTHIVASQMFRRLVDAGLNPQHVTRHHNGQYTVVLPNEDYGAATEKLNAQGYQVVKAGYGLAYGYPTRTPAIRFVVPQEG